MILAGALLLIGAVVLFILQPLVRGEWASLDRERDELTDVEARRRVTLLALRDVEYDYHTGKLDEGDYQELRRELSAEALEALEAAQRDAESDEIDTLEAEIAAVREGLRGGTVCPDCGHRNPAASRFCAGCGVRLSEDPRATAPAS